MAAEGVFLAAIGLIMVPIEGGHLLFATKVSKSDDRVCLLRSPGVAGLIQVGVRS